MNKKLVWVKITWLNGGCFTISNNEYPKVKTGEQLINEVLKDMPIELKDKIKSREIL